MSAAIQGIYIALFGRPADPGGLAYWTEVTKGGADLSAMLSVLPNLTEYTARFEGQTPDQVITTVYQNLFGRAPDAEGLAFFKGQLASGAQTLATIAVNIMQGAQGDDKADVTAKVGAAELFTASLDTPEEIAAYQGADAAALAKKFLDTVDKDKPATPESVEKAAGAVVAGQDPTGGQAPNPGGGGTGGGTPQPDVVTKAINHAVQSNSGELFVGGGNSADGFVVTTNVTEGIELGLSARYRFGDVLKSSALDANGVAHFEHIDPSNLAFAYSVASLDGDALTKNNFVLTLSGGEKDVKAFLVEHEGNLQWTFDANGDGAVSQEEITNGFSILDDGQSADGLVTQNIQPFAYLLTAAGIDPKSAYSVKLEAFDGAELVAKSEIRIDAADMAKSVDGSVRHNSQTANLYVGKGNSEDGFSVVRNIDEGIELGISGRYQNGALGTVVAATDQTGSDVFKYSMTDVQGAAGARFAYSVNAEAGLDKYNFVLKIDTDKGTETNFITFNLVAEPSSSVGKSNPNGPGSVYDSKFSWKGAERAITDDGGDNYTTQNIQSFGFYDDVDGINNPVPGVYDVVLQAFNLDGTMVAEHRSIFTVTTAVVEFG